ncbi:retroviral-like aspartic protease family protein [Qipengyuania soli]|uniref:Aspartyl protease family protein n=1 Tax=Qipengyuania soli TaxID=2782568 RepID=A0A7S8IUU9_9SPHN|nr:retroviral-like aspartic protease family protein [Qipengyuania soli]QPC98176.1 aspartyl protease family protein [Qipengyuania soli]
MVPLKAGLVLALFAALPAAAQDHAAPAPMVDEAALQKDRYERMTVPVTVDGAGPYRFLIDTGAQATVVTHEMVDDLALRRSGTATLVAMGSSQEVETIELDDLEFANRSVSGLIAPLLHASHIGADGILGLDSLQDMRVLIDFRERRMQVADADSLGGNYGYEIVVRARPKLGQMIITDARVNGVKTSVIIDTGAQNTIANPALMARLRGRKGEDVKTIDVLGTELSSKSVLVRTLQISDVVLTEVPIAITDSPIFAALGLEDKPALVLGVNNLSVFNRVAIDFPTRRILFDIPSDSANGRAAITSIRRFGT